MARNKKKAEGLGDVIEQFTEATGIKAVVEVVSKATGIECGCEERKAALNKLFNFRTVRCLTDEESAQYKEFRATHTDRLDDSQVKYICKLYADVFGVPYYEPCRNCGGPSPIKAMLDKLDKASE
jgi:hypothetical protein